MPLYRLSIKIKFVKIRTGGLTDDVVENTDGLIIEYQSVILTGINRVVVVDGMESVETLQIIVLVTTVQTTDVYTKSGEIQMEHRSGDTTDSVVVTTPYLTVHLVSVILTGRTRVVVGIVGIIG